MKLSLLFALLLASAIAGQANNILTLSSAQTIVNPGDIVSLDVDLTATDPVFGYQFDLNYPTSLSFLSATEEGDFAVNGICGPPSPCYDTPDDINGIVTNVYDALTGSNPATSPETMVTFQFTVVGSGTASFSLANIFLPDDSGDSLEVDPVDDLGITATPEPSTACLALLAIAFVYWRFRTRKTTLQ
jgi:hypothetical protein